MERSERKCSTRVQYIFLFRGSSSRSLTRFFLYYVGLRRFQRFVQGSKLIYNINPIHFRIKCHVERSERKCSTRVRYIFLFRGPPRSLTKVRSSSKLISVYNINPFRFERQSFANEKRNRVDSSRRVVAAFALLSTSSLKFRISPLGEIFLARASPSK